MTQAALILAVAFVLVAWIAILWTYRRELYCAWKEPVLKEPVMILESDDWGPGPREDARRLDRLGEVLRGYRDEQGHPPVATLGVILGTADPERIREADFKRYFRQTLQSEKFKEICNAMVRGSEEGVFALQLHGLEHFWPTAVMTAAQHNTGVQEWLVSGEVPDAAELPAHLQSRWVDARTLPTSPIPEPDILAAADEEVAAFAGIFGFRPRVAVPPTFVWDRMAERAWSRNGVEVVVTPGRRCEGRDRDGQPVNGGAPSYNGQRAYDAAYVVRDIYFEPSYGHTAEQAVAAIEGKHRLGRPALVEMHRFNFTGGETQAQSSLKELNKLLGSVLRALPDVRFMSTARLGELYRRGDATVFDRRPGVRLHACLRRLGAIPRLRKLSRLSGLALPAWVLMHATRAAGQPSSMLSTTPHAH